jgi:hypothetical protein
MGLPPEDEIERKQDWREMVSRLVIAIYGFGLLFTTVFVIIVHDSTAVAIWTIIISVSYASRYVFTGKKRPW